LRSDVAEFLLLLTSVLILEFQYCWLLLSCGVPAVLTFATGVFDTGGACTLPSEYLREFTEKIEMSLIGGMEDDD